ncbi:hypothetical protein FRC09_013317 [Ceratobasidium sp. 395]|nr:hypothetical protein FRC09_013317 [Ceratobasidium sp. 395]
MSMPSTIPVLQCGEEEFGGLLDRVNTLLLSASAITVFSGDTLSWDRKQGVKLIPNYDSESSFAPSHRVTSGDFFRAKTLEEPLRRFAFGKIFAGMRKVARTAELRSRHLCVKHLFTSGRLVRCYTQDVNGWYQRGDEGLAAKTEEINGSNLYIRCSRCGTRPSDATETFDDELLLVGEVFCQNCANATPVPQWGKLAPDVSLSDTSSLSPESENRLLQMVNSDASRCNVLLILAPRFRSVKGEALLAQLATKVQEAGGIVVYVDWRRLEPNPWGRRIDLQVEADVDVWARSLLETAGTPVQPLIRAAFRTEITELRAKVREASEELEVRLQRQKTLEGPEKRDKKDGARAKEQPEEAEGVRGGAADEGKGGERKQSKPSKRVRFANSANSTGSKVTRQGKRLGKGRRL